MKKKQWFEIWVSRKKNGALILAAKTKSQGLTNLIAIFLKTFYETVEVQ